MSRESALPMGLTGWITGNAYPGALENARELRDRLSRTQKAVLLDAASKR